ncbi:peptidase S8/S53 domain-containing protein [Aspergillus leporis]|uniref:Peptidase S8/S53 domain-containing protein n=1 Tax=Aspergillus leporis TaxID=41062 RepID=A0A5N5WFQ0_9EURO|nr:peptidase S8/S53 domain-containing protein [Aspergillus leporis]
MSSDPISLNESLRFEQYHVRRDTPFWGPSQVSLPKGSIWGSPGSSSFDPNNPNGDKFTYNYDVASALDTYVYMINEEGVWEHHNEFMGRSIEHLDSQHNFGPNTGWKPHYEHGSGVAAQVIGNRVGICPSCTLVVVTTKYPNKKIENWQTYPNEKVISQLLDTLDDIKRKKRQGKTTLTMSFSYSVQRETSLFHMTIRHLLQKLDDQGVVVVASANNHADKPKEGIPMQRYPAKFADPNDVYGGLENMIVVAASDWKTQKAYFSNYSPFVATFAPGEDVTCPADPVDQPGNIMKICSGTSFAAPQVAALANYFRAVPSPWQSQLDKPSNVKKLIQLFARRFAVYGHNVDPAARRPIIWNGQVGEHSCLREYGSKEDWARVCPTIRDNLGDEPANPGQPVEPCGPGQDGNPTRLRRQDSGSCPRIPGDNGPGKNINWQDGPSAPKCGGDHNCGGELCHGYYCDPHPDIRHPPDYYDPKDPKNPHGKPPEEPTSTTTGTSPTPTPIKKFPLCLGLSTTPSPQYPIYAYSVYKPGSHCFGVFITDGNIGSSTPICDIPNNKVSFNYCGDGDATFVNQGPEFFSKCGFQIALDGKRYTPRQLDPGNKNNPCSGICSEAVTSVQGILLYEDLPGCPERSV